MGWSLRGTGRGTALGRILGPASARLSVPEPAVEREIRIEDFDYPSAPPPAALERAGIVIPPLVSLGSVIGGEVFAFAAPAADRASWWHRMRFVHPMTGLWPVLLGEEPSYRCDALSGGEFDYDGVDVLEEASRTSMAELPYLREIRAEVPELEVNDTFARLLSTDDAVASVERLERAAPSFPAGMEPGLVGLVPAAQGWEVPGILGFYVDGRSPLDHVVVLREWNTRYAAELVSLGGEGRTLEVLVRQPPLSPADALVLALEQYSYCPGIVESVEDLPEHALQLQGDRSWFFWWS